MLISSNGVHFLDLKCFLAFLLIQGSTPDCVPTIPEEVRIESYQHPSFRFFPHRSTRSPFLRSGLFGTCIKSLMLLGLSCSSHGDLLHAFCLSHALLVGPILICPLPSFSSWARFQVIPGQCPKLPKSSWILSLSLEA